MSLKPSLHCYISFSYTPYASPEIYTILLLAPLLTIPNSSALPILRQLGTGTTFLKSVREGDTSMLRVWVGLEARTFLQASVESVEMCVKYDLLSPNI